MKIKTIVYAQTLTGVVGNDDVRDSLNDLLSEYEITTENLIDIKINTHPVYNVIMSEDTYFEGGRKYEYLERDADYTSTRYIATIIYKTEE